MTTKTIDRTRLYLNSKKLLKVKAFRRRARLFFLSVNSQPWHAFAATCAAFILAISIKPLGAAPGQWQSLGPDGGRVSEVAISPVDPTRIVVSGQNGVFRSGNGGQSWQDISAGLPTRGGYRLAIGRTDADLIAVYGGRFLLSNNSGESWQTIEIDNEEVILPWHLALSEDDQQITVATAVGLFRSNDQGSNWQRIESELFLEPIVQMISVPDNENAMLIMARPADPDQGLSQLFRTLDNGQTWDGPLTNPGLQGGSPPRLWSASQGRIVAKGWEAQGDSQTFYYTDDIGETWTPFSVSRVNEFGLNEVMVVDPDAPEIMYFGFPGGLLKTTDSGTSWSAISEGMGPQHADGYNAGAHAVGITSGPQKAIFVGSLEAGLYWSNDSGENWERRNSGLHQTNIRSLALNPLNPSIVYAGSSDARFTISDNIWSSFDSGTSWSVSSQGLGLGGVRGLAIDTNTAANPLQTALFAAGWGRPIYDASLPPQSPSHGIFRSITGGAGWSELQDGISEPGPGIGDRVMRAVMLDPGSVNTSGRAQTVWIAGDGFIGYDDISSEPIVEQHRIYKSLDGGDSWSAADAGLPIPAVDQVSSSFFVQGVVPMAMSSENPEVLYVGTTLGIFVDKQSTIENGVFKSINGGQTWQLASNGLPRVNEGTLDSSHWNVMALAVSESDPGSLFAAVSLNVDGFRHSRIYRSIDGAQSWSLASGGLPLRIDIRWLTIDPVDPDMVYFANSNAYQNAAVYRSINGGQDWSSYSIGLRANRVSSLSLDRSGANPVLLAGGHGGVYRMEVVPDADLDGIPDSVEQEAPYDGDGNQDGILDALQSDVASLPAATGSMRSISDYLTIEILNAGNGECSQLMNVHALGWENFPTDAGFEYGYGMLHFEISNCPQATVRIIYHDRADIGFSEDWHFRVFAPDLPDSFNNFTWRSFDSIAEVDGHVWEMSLEDGAFGDQQRQNGMIMLRGGVAKRVGEVLFQDRFEE